VKSAWVTGRERIEIFDKDYEKPSNGEVVVRVRLCGICGTDLHFYNDFPGGKPIPLGHEVAGVVHEIGACVEDLKPGTSVIVQNHVPCGRCSPCLQGDYARCLDIQTYMNDRAALAEFLRVKRAMIVPFENLSFSEAAIAEPLTVALDVMREAAVQPFHNVIVSGPGIIGLFCTKLASLAGGDTIIVLGHRLDTERGRARSEAAMGMGATAVIDADTPGWQNEVRERFSGPVHRIIVTSPPRTIPPLFELASFGAWIVYNGISFREEDITFNANSFHFKKLRLIASHAIPNWGFPLALELLSRKEHGLNSLVTHQFPFDRIEEAFRTARSSSEGVIKVVITAD
jgi:L-iditol 2-dehydrogenase